MVLAVRILADRHGGIGVVAVAMEADAVATPTGTRDRVAGDRRQVDVGGDRGACVVEQSDPAHAVVGEAHREPALGDPGTMPHLALGGGGARKLGGLDLLAGLVHDPDNHVIGRGVSFVEAHQIVALAAFPDHHHVARGEEFPITDPDVAGTRPVLDRHAVDDAHRTAGVGHQLDGGPVTRILVPGEFHHLEAQIEGGGTHAQSVAEEVRLDLGSPTGPSGDRGAILAEVGQEP